MDGKGNPRAARGILGVRYARRARCSNVSRHSGKHPSEHVAVIMSSHEVSVSDTECLPS
jgi:hypothetical protein